MPNENDMSPFRLSRIYAEGWNAARNLPAVSPLSGERIAKLNPYGTEPARSRWIEGFTKARE